MARKHLVWLVALAAHAAGGQAVCAEESCNVDLGRVLVSPLRMMPGTAIDEAKLPGNATVITSEEIAASGVATVPDALNRAEGVTVTDTNGFGVGSDATVNLRGVVNSSRTNALVLVDGVRQNRITGDEVHWQSIPIEQVERIEILRGGGGTIYGEGALAGVINITTKKFSPRPLAGESGIEAGSFGQLKYWTSLRGSDGPVTYGVSATRRDVQGYRESSGTREVAINTHAGVRLGAWDVQTNVLHSEDTTYFPGGITVAQTEQRRRQRGGFFLVENEIDQVGLDATGELGAGFSVGANTYYRRWIAEFVRSHFQTNAPSTGLGLRLSHAEEGRWLQHAFISGIDLSDDKAVTGTRGTARMDESNRGAIGLYAEETLTLWDRVTLVAGYRFDQARYEEDITFPVFIGTLRFQGHSPKIGATLHVTPHADVFVSYARAFKAPNIDDLAAVVPLQFFGNTSLVPQIADHYEVGARLRPHGWWPLSLEASYFHIHGDDEILYDPFSFQNNNFDTRRDGVEVSLTGRWWEDRVQAYSNCTYVKARFSQGQYTGYRLPLTPAYQFKTGGSVEVLPHLTVGMDWELVSTQFRVNDFTNQLPADNYGVARLTLRYALKHVTAYINLENLTNEEYTTFQSSLGSIVSTGENPAPPFSLLAGVVIKF